MYEYVPRQRQQDSLISINQLLLSSALPLDLITAVVENLLSVLTVTLLNKEVDWK